MDERQAAQILWEYYKAEAEVRGASPGEAGQQPYSLLWFFQQDPLELNPLVRGFLGDTEALELLHWNESPPEDWESFLLEGPPPNESQRGAIRSALAAPLTFIQGPPGTGKTATILNLACCAARSGGGGSVAIVSSNNSALTNLWEKIQEYGEEEPNRRWLKRHFARLGGSRRRKQFQGVSGEGVPVFRFSSQPVSVPSDREVLTVSRERSIRAGDFLAAYPIVTSTIHSLQNCFSDGTAFLYDYVIMDESSQTDAVAGLAAMSCARHLVLVGDPKQLPPVVPAACIREMAELAGRKGWTIPQEHAAAPDRSFLDVCLDVFRDRTARTVLRSHYRCHPGIIGFCAREIYQEERLEICTPGWDASARTPIRVLWFEGDYCEPWVSPEGGRRSRHNRKQLLCFLEEEWPQLRERLARTKEAGGKPLSVCILSPFRGQLMELDRAIRADLAACGQEDVDLTLEEDLEPDGGGLVRLTIHKSQGREYDIVYLLPVEDGDWEWPWSQQKRLINVAVSRARKELRLVLSSILMEEDMQAELTGRPVSSPRRNTDPERERDQRFLQKLVRYVREENQALEAETGLAGYPESGYEFGFHRSVRASIFDRKPWLRTVRESGRRNQEETDMTEKQNPWTPELCAEMALVGMMREIREKQGISLTLLRDVPLQDIRDRWGRPPALPEDGQEMAQLLEHGGHLDFVLCLDGRILLALEVDGSFHRDPGREGERQRIRDAAKDRLLREVLGADCREGNARAGGPVTAEGSFTFLRLSDGGGTCLETAELWEAAPEEWKALYFPIEELLEARLQKPEGGASYHVPLKSTTVLVRDWLEPDRAAVSAAVGILLEKGLVEKRPCVSLGGDSRPTLAPTEKGRRLGIIESIQFQRIEGTLYGNALYPPQAQRKVLELLNGYPLPEADMPVWKLLHLVFQHLQSYLDTLESLEARKEALSRLGRDISFRQDGTDYSREEAQALYLLRYLYGYAYEYKQLYLSVLDQMKPWGKRLSVTSIGCGSLVDYWSLRAALSSRPGAAEGVDYTGVDLSVWSRKFRIRAAEGDRAEFVRADAAAYLREQAASGGEASDIYIFPKSIGEFDGRKTVGGTVLEAIRDGLRDILRASSKDRVWMLFSLPRSDGFAKEDREKCAFLREGLTQAGFHAFGPEDVFVTAEERQAIMRADSSFYYPGFVTLGMNAYGDYDGKRDPVLTTGYECYQALLFERKGDFA